MSPADLDPSAAMRRVLLGAAVELGLALLMVAVGALVGGYALIAAAVVIASRTGARGAWFAAHRLRAAPPAAQTPLLALGLCLGLSLIALILARVGMGRLTVLEGGSGLAMLGLGLIALLCAAVSAALLFTPEPSPAGLRILLRRRGGDLITPLILIGAALLTLIWPARFVDPIAGIVLAGVMLSRAGGELWHILRARLRRDPEAVPPAELAQALQGLPGVSAVYGIYRSAPTKGQRALRATLGVAVPDWATVQTIHEVAAPMMQEGFGFDRVSLRYEPSDPEPSDTAAGPATAPQEA